MSSTAPVTQAQDKDIVNAIPGSGSAGSKRSKRFWLILGAILLVVIIALAVGLGVGLSRKDSDSDSDSSSDSESSASDSNSGSGPDTDATNNTSKAGTYWKPTAGESWQIVLGYALNDTSPNVSVYDIDLVTNPTSTITELHKQGRKVICYFSAGSYEDFRPDSSEFKREDYGKPLDGWPGEWWLNTTSSNVRRIMIERLTLAASKGCDGVDPDNVDGYDNDTGLDLTTADAVNYMKFLAGEAHGRNMSIGLKNAGVIVNQTLSFMEWDVNEQCVQYQECDLFRPFIDAGKPVFHIEYPDSAPRISEKTKEDICGDADAKGFSTVMKEMQLTNFVEQC